MVRHARGSIPHAGLQRCVVHGCSAKGLCDVNLCVLGLAFHTWRSSTTEGTGNMHSVGVAGFTLLDGPHGADRPQAWAGIALLGSSAYIVRSDAFTASCA